MVMELFPESWALPGFVARPGGHCESAALLNALAHLGYGITEADIIGGGAAPAFLFTDASFPFLGARNLSMRERFLAAAAIPWKVVVPTGSGPDWPRMEGLLSGGLPVLLRVDMRHLPYLYGGKKGPAYMSFGWHWICLAGLDRAAGRAWVTDTAHPGLQSLSIRELEAARLSRTKVWPPRGEYAWIEPMPEGWRLDPDALVQSGLAGMLENYDGKGGAEEGPDGHGLWGLAGLGQLPARLAGLDFRLNAFTLGPAWSYLAASIERNGTGGGAFRRLFASFLATRAEDCRGASLRDGCASLAPLAARASAAWTGLSLSLDEAALALKAARGGKGKKEAVAKGLASTATSSERVLTVETEMRNALAGMAWLDRPGAWTGEAGQGPHRRPRTDQGRRAPGDLSGGSAEDGARKAEDHHPSTLGPAPR